MLEPFQFNASLWNIILLALVYFEPLIIKYIQCSRFLFVSCSILFCQVRAFTSTTLVSTLNLVRKKVITNTPIQWWSILFILSFVYIWKWYLKKKLAVMWSLNWEVHIVGGSLLELTWSLGAANTILCMLERLTRVWYHIGQCTGCVDVEMHDMHSSNKFFTMTSISITYLHINNVSTFTMVNSRLLNQPCKPRMMKDIKHIDAFSKISI